MKGSSDAMDAEAASATAPRAGPASLTSVRLDLARHLGQPLSESAEEVGACLEPILVQVPGRAFARPEQEVTLEECVLYEEAPELVRHLAVASAAICSSRSSSGDPASSVTDEPSA